MCHPHGWVTVLPAPICGARSSGRPLNRAALDPAGETARAEPRVPGCTVRKQVTHKPIGAIMGVAAALAATLPVIVIILDRARPKFDLQYVSQ